MVSRILVAATVAMSLATAAFAQSNSGNEGGSSVDSAKLPGAWSGDIGDAFFSDQTNMTLRSQSEIQTNWKSLSPDQQTQVRTNCSAIKTVEGSGGATGTNTNPLSTTETMSGTSPGVSASEPLPTTDSAQSLKQLCSWVDGM